MTKALAFSQRLIALRKLNGMTQADLADRLGISRSAIYWTPLLTCSTWTSDTCSEKMTARSTIQAADSAP